MTVDECGAGKGEDTRVARFESEFASCEWAREVDDKCCNIYTFVKKLWTFVNLERRDLSTAVGRHAAEVTAFFDVSCVFRASPQN